MVYSDIRARARASLAGKWAQAIAVCLVAFVLGGAIISFNFLPQITFKWEGEITSLEDAVTALTTLSRSFGNTTISIGALGLVEFILGGVIQLGYAKYLLKQYNHQDAAISDLFSEFERFGQGFAQMFLRRLYTFLWGLLFFIPGIVKSLSYAMTPFIMADHPNLTAREAIQVSRDMMDGHKWELFVLHLSFIGWSIAAAFTMNLGNLVLNPYRNAAEAAFYREISRQPRYTVES